ncbi:MAG: DNA (cytosine-5-)-methyltransferase [Fusobacteriaceae bacterium]|nr:DNA (cytosine-5-)-methyltransferase [Fusobacteriaceae bacterium]
MNVLSLFDGMSAGQLALSRAGIKVDKYFASEIEKSAIKITMKNFPDTIQLGSVVDVKCETLPKIDLLIGGSPCQSFSMAGKQKGMVTKCNINIVTLEQYLNLKKEGFEFEGQSYLFWEYMRIYKELKPKFFLLENVRMDKRWENLISETIGIKPIFLNSALVSAQNRERNYWTNISISGLPEDKKIMLKDIVHENVDIECSSTNGDKAHCLTSSYNGAVWWNSIERKQRTMLFEELTKYIVPFDDTLKILNKEVDKGKVGYFKTDSQANRVYHIHDKAVTLCGEAGGGSAKMGQYLLGCISPDRIEKRQNGQRFSNGKKFYTLTA